jgi:hypothetical protein
VGDHRVLRLGWWYCAACLAVAAVVAAAAFGMSLAGSANAQRDQPTPEELWDAYPLDPEGKRTEQQAPPGTTGPRGETSPSASPTPRPTIAQAPAADDDGGLPTTSLLAAVLIAFTGGMVAGRIRKRRIAAARSAAVAPMASLIARAAAPPEVEETKARRPAPVEADEPEQPAPSFLELEALEPESAELVEPEPAAAEPLELALPETEPPRPEPARSGSRRTKARGGGGSARARRTKRRAAVEPDEKRQAAQASARESDGETPEAEATAAEALEAEVEAPVFDAPEVDALEAEVEAHEVEVPEVEPPVVEALEAEVEPAERAGRRNSYKAPQPALDDVFAAFDHVEDPAPETVAVPPSQRFVRRAPWTEADKLWSCEIAWKPGYLKSYFQAMAAPPGSKQRESIGESPSLRWTLMMDPDPPTLEMVAAVRELAEALEAAGWERTEAEGPWYELRFLWRWEGEPRRVEVPGRKALKGTEDEDE